MEKCDSCGKPLVLKGGRCIYCQFPADSYRQDGQQPRVCENGNDGQRQQLKQFAERFSQSYHDILVFYRRDRMEMAKQINDGLRDLGYDCVLMEIDNAFTSKDDEYRLCWKVQINHCKDFFIVITADMADALLNPCTDVHFLLRYLLPYKYGEQKFKDNVHVYIERNYLPILDETKFNLIREQLDRDGYYSEVLDSTFVYPLKILHFDKKTGRYAVAGFRGRLNCSKKF